jgi:hypothetical protein
MPKRIRRRTFLAAGPAMSWVAGSLSAKELGDADQDQFVEPQRGTPLVRDTDVIVCGAGPAGVAAAIAAARAGARTTLIESNGCLGGVWTAGLLSWILDSGNKSGLMREILARLAERNASAVYRGSVGYAVEPMKLLLEEMCLEAGVEIRLHTRVVAAYRVDRSVDVMITESKSGRQAWRASCFVDATGDGDLAALAGCQFAYGDPETGRAQPMSFIVLVTGIDPDAVKPFVRELAEPSGWSAPKDRLRAEMMRAGQDPSYAKPTLFYIRPGLFCLMANHEYDVNGCDASDVTRATLQGRREVHQLVNGLKGLGGVWKDLQIVATPEHIGVREGRRVRGRYLITENDLAEGAKHADAVCEVRFPVDVHSTDPTRTKGITAKKVRAKPYDVPFRALIARDVDRLLLAGRCISGDFIAHSSYRVTGNSVPMGEAAGAAAALCAASGTLPQDIPWSEIRETVHAVTAG